MRFGSDERPFESAYDVVSTPISCAPLPLLGHSSKIVTRCTCTPDTSPERKVNPYEPADPLSVSHVANSLCSSAVPLTLQAVGNVSFSMPTATCCSASLSSAMCVFRKTLALTVASVSPTGM